MAPGPVIISVSFAEICGSGQDERQNNGYEKRKEMSTVRICLEFDRYQPGHDDPFRRRGGGWLNMDDLKERVGDLLEKATDLMDYDDHLTITIESTPKEDEE